MYRARDTRLDRIVAVKILPEHLTGPEALQRFDREARAISSLSHPNVCHLYDVGQQNGAHYLVMEYLEGETLADRLRKGALPLEQVLKVGIEICDGLEAAHRKGVVHRDLKPGNIMLTKSGAKLMDFGLAKPVQAAPAASTLTRTLTTSHAPVTMEGTLVGTFQYMSPEQVEGSEADARSDIFALGAVLYEMATGKRAFEGKTSASTIAAILAAHPKPLSAVQPTSPPALDFVIRTRFAKDPDERWQSTADVARQLRWVSETPSTAVIAPQPSGRAAWIVAAIAGLIMAGAAFWLGSLPHGATPSVVTFQVAAPEKTYFDFRGLSGPPTPSPDGKHLVFVAYAQGQSSTKSLWLRTLQSSDMRMIAGSENATYPFWSPDGNTVAFFAEGKLKRFDLPTSSLMTVCGVPEGRGGAWSTNGMILFGGRADSLYRVDASGGKAVRLTTLDPKLQETSHRWPQFLPDQKHFLYVSQAPTNPPAHLMVASLTAGKAACGRSEVWHLLGRLSVLHAGNDLLARRFDPDRLQLTGDSTVLARQVQNDPQFNFGAFSVVPSVLTYQTGAVAAGTWLVEADRGGKQRVLWKEAGLLQNLSLSPHGDQIVADIGLSSGQLADLWTYNLPKHTRTRLTFDQHSTGPVWSPDGTQIAFSRQTETGSQNRH